MLFPSDRRVTQPLSNDTNRLTDPSLPSTSAMPTPLPPGQLKTPLTTTKLPVVIPASTSSAKRQRTERLVPPPRQHRIIVLPGVLLGSLVMIVLASLFVIPLDNGQQSKNFAQKVSTWFASGPFRFTTSQYLATSAVTPVLFTGNEGYCGGKDIWGVCATVVTGSGFMGTGQMQHPIQGAVITQPFGHLEYQSWCGCWKPHTGIDLAAPYGTPIMAADSGQVIWTGWDWSGLGWAVKINHGKYIATIYGHLQRFIVKVGQDVTKGQVIAYEGSTGASTGPHLHFMVMVNNFWVDPQHYVRLP